MGASAPADPVDLRHHRATRAPLLLADAHRASAVGDVVSILVPAGWTASRRQDIVRGAGFTLVGGSAVGGGTVDGEAEHLVVEARRERELPDIVGPGMALLLVGLNPSLYAADAGIGFARPGNRFWPAALAAGLATVDRDPRDLLRRHHVGMTDLVKRATVGADALSVDEYRTGLARVERLCRWLRPGSVCFLGLDGWRKAVDRKAGTGWQEQPIGGSPAYVMPNPSGLNAHATVAGLAAHLRAAVAGRGARRQG